MAVQSIAETGDELTLNEKVLFAQARGEIEKADNEATLDFAGNELRQALLRNYGSAFEQMSVCVTVQRLKDRRRKEWQRIAQSGFTVLREEE